MAIQRWSEHIWVAKLGPDPGLSEDIDVLYRQTREDQPPPDMVLDLSALEHLNSSHLSRLLRLRKAMIERDGRLRLAAPTDAIWSLLLATGLDKVFEFAADTPSALAELQIGPAE